MKQGATVKHRLEETPLLESYGDAGTQSTGTYWLILGAFAVVFLVATWGLLVRSTRRSMR